MRKTISNRKDLIKKKKMIPVCKDLSFHNYIHSNPGHKCIDKFLVNFCTVLDHNLLLEFHIHLYQINNRALCSRYHYNHK